MKMKMKIRTRIRRPKSKTKKCVHCERRRLSKFIEWHPGIEEWQCSDFNSCDKVLNKLFLTIINLDE